MRLKGKKIRKQIVNSLFENSMQNSTKYSNLLNLTIVIPTFNRQEFMMRQIAYWKNSGVTMIILDGSNTPVDRELNKHLESDDKINYIYDTSSLTKRLSLASKYLKTKYTVYCSDDDFLLPLGLSKSIEALENDNKAVASVGQTLRFNYLRNNKISYGSCYQYESFYTSKDNYIQRLEYAANNYTAATCFAVMRTDIWIKSWGNIPSYSSSQVLELFQAFTVYISGNLLIQDQLYLLRTLENLPLSSIDNNREISSYDWCTLNEHRKEKEDFISRCILQIKSLEISSQPIHILRKNLNTILENLTANLKNSSGGKHRLNPIIDQLKRLKFVQMFKSIFKFIYPSYDKLNYGYLSDLKKRNELKYIDTGILYEDIQCIESILYKFYK
jgi:glycosyltransferase domain-containing protein